VSCLGLPERSDLAERMECVGSNAKKKTTMAKRNRENALRDDDY
jgi:hypothetical protein